MKQPPADGLVSLVIPTWNGGELFDEVLAGWRAQEGFAGMDICCPDSGSSDGTLEVIRRHGARTLPIPQRMFNHGETRNRAVATTHSKYVILSVQDAKPLTTKLVRALIAPMEDDPTLSATYGRQQPRPDCHPVLAERIDNWAGGHDVVVQELGEDDWRELDPFERLGLIRYDHVIACMRRSAWERQRFEHVSFGEDVTWAARIIRSGGRIAFVPDAVVEHSHNRTAWDEARRIYCDHSNLRKLVGLTTVPHRKQIAPNVEAAREHYRRLVEQRTDVDATTRANWTEWAEQLAYYENWAQYLGANFSRRWWFRPLDRWLRKQI